eukprot:scaffold1096_cov171-Pinguiococcus_pyrenoidosus.AAC.2
MQVLLLRLRATSRYAGFSRNDGGRGLGACQGSLIRRELWFCLASIGYHLRPTRELLFLGIFRTSVRGA